MGRRWMTVAEAAEQLGVKRETVYAYASRGMLHSRKAPDGRVSLFDPGEVERLARRGRRGSGQDPLVIRSSLTTIDGTSFHYRGHDAVALSRTHSFEEVAALLWGLGPQPPPWRTDRDVVSGAVRAQRSIPEGTWPFERLRLIVAAMAPRDHLRFDTSPEAVVSTGRSLIAGLVEALPEIGPRPHGERLSTLLWSRLSPRPPRRGLLGVLEAAMVLCADHELSPSTLAVRIAASQRAEPYSVVTAGMGVFAGTLHGAASLAAEEMLDEVERPEHAAEAIGHRLRRGEYIPGFGMPLYPGGDPRGSTLLDLLADHVPARRLTGTLAVAETMRARGLPEPNIDFGLAALAHCAEMVKGAGEVIMCVSRVAGWIAHALEEYEQRSAFRTRAVYTGPPPAS